MDNIKLLFLIAVLVQFSFASEDDQIYRPCSFRNYKCIGNILQERSNCSRPSHPFIPAKFVIPEVTIQAQVWNASYIETGLVVRKLDHCWVSEFYFNPVTDKVVLSIACPDLDLEADLELIHHRPRREDDIYNYHVRAKYPLIDMTLIFPSSRTLDLTEASTYTEVHGVPDFVVRPFDERSARFEAEKIDYSYLNKYDAEAFYYRGYPIVRHFVQRMLCNYGLKNMNKTC